MSSPPSMPGAEPGQAASATADQQGPPTGKAQETLSQFVAKILDQLSITTWLPAATLVLLVTVAVAVWQADGDLQEALDDITAMTWQSLVLLLVGVVIVTIVTQAFEFEAIRLLEGYWGTSFFSRSASEVGSRLHTWRRNRVRTNFKKTRGRAFADARTEMLEGGIDRMYVDVLEARFTGNFVGNVPVEIVTAAEQIDWLSYARPRDVRTIARYETRLEEYPEEPYRIMPTRLGNTLRAYEDRVHDPKEGRLEGLVLKLYHKLPVSLQSEHDQYRNRLDLYCSLLFVLLLSAIAVVPLFLPLGWEYVAISVGGLVIMAILSYRAAVASARGYGTALEAISELRDAGQL